LRRRAQDPEGFPKALTVSALEDAGLEKAWDEMRALCDWRCEHGHWDARRANQARHWFEEEVRQGLLKALTASEEVRAAMRSGAEAVARGDKTPDSAAAEVLQLLAPRA
jgi:LAO/AO transport system kinase